MEHCFACSMPLMRDEDKGIKTEAGTACAYCTNENGELKSCSEIFEGGVQFFMQSTGSGRDLAERLVRKNMNSLPYWQKNPSELLDGEEASDEEFADAMKKLQQMS